MPQQDQVRLQGNQRLKVQHKGIAQAGDLPGCGGVVSKADGPDQPVTGADREHQFRDVGSEADHTLGRPWKRDHPASVIGDLKTAADFDLGGQLMGFIHWLPARVLAFTFCLVGDFSATAPVAVASVRNPSMPPVDVLSSAAAASCPALAVPTAADAADSEMGEQAAQVERQLDAVVGLLNRSLVLWLGSLALWTLFAGAG